MSEKILIVDDEESIVKVLSIFLKKNDYLVDSASSLAQTYKKIKENSYSIIFLDVNLPDGISLDYLEKIINISNNTSIVIMTAQDSMENAINSMKLGAYDYIPKPIDLNNDLLLLIERGIKNTLKNIEISQLKTDLIDSKKEDFQIIGKSSQMQKIFKDIGKISTNDHTVLIRGESGTGKELIAKAIHLNSSNSNGNYVQVNITAIPSELLESELFGYEKGAFTGAEKRKIGRFEEANNGTILLDEIGDMSLDLQSKLLRVLEEKKFYRLGSQKPTSFNSRIIASTNKSLELLVKKNEFRDDLFFRLNTLTVDLPALKDRKSDLPLLLNFFNEKYVSLNGQIKSFDEDVLNIFAKYDWPGNVREFENTIKKLSIMSTNIEISKVDVQNYFPNIMKQVNSSEDEINFESLIGHLLNHKKKHIGYDKIMNKFRKTLIETSLAKNKGILKETAEQLEISDKNLNKLIKELDIDTNIFVKL